MLKFLLSDSCCLLSKQMLFLHKFCIIFSPQVSLTMPNIILNLIVSYPLNRLQVSLSLSLFFLLAIQTSMRIIQTHKIVMFTNQTEVLIISLRFFVRFPHFLGWTLIPWSHFQNHLLFSPYLPKTYTNLVLVFLAIFTVTQNINMNVRYQFSSMPKDITSIRRKKLT